jgi:hypothetical protein
MPSAVTVLSTLGDLAALLSVVVLGLVTAAKGRGWLLALGFVLTPIVWIYAALRLAAPSSVWAARWYDGEKLNRARSRFGSDDAGERSKIMVWVTAVIFAGASVYAVLLAFSVAS